MAWNNKYWDTLDQLYWTPDYLGLRTLRPERGDNLPGYLLIPRAEVNAGASIYTRKRNAQEQRAYLNSREETLNHILDIAFAIAPDALIADLIGAPLGIDDHGPFESIGREADARFGLATNVFQQDGFFVSPRSALALEIKLSSPSSPEQVVKYACMHVLEENAVQTRKTAGLLYVAPAHAEKALWRSCGLEGPMPNADLVDVVKQRNRSQVLLSLISEHDDAIRDVLTRMTLGFRSWKDLRDRIAAIEAALDDQDPTQQCYQRLLLGLRTQIEQHDGTLS